MLIPYVLALGQIAVGSWSIGVTGFLDSDLDHPSVVKGSTQDKQCLYADQRHREVRFALRDPIHLKVSSTKGNMDSRSEVS